MPANPPLTPKIDLQNKTCLSLLTELFDSAWYLRHYPDAIRALDECENITALDHCLVAGVDGRPVSPFFDAEWYLTAYPEVTQQARREGHSTAAAQRFYAFVHYLEYGTLAGYNPSPIFDEAWYRSEYENPNRNREYTSDYHHFLAIGAAAGLNPSPLFDESWYRERYQDVAGAIQQGLLQSGFHDYSRRLLDEERDPTPYFKAAWFQAAYPQHISGYRLAYLDYLCVGAGGGYNPSIHFDESWYRTTHAEVRAVISEGRQRSAYHHFAYRGAQDGYAPNPYFLPHWYENWYPQVKESLSRGEFKHAFDHYLRLGAKQGLSPNPWFNETWYLDKNSDVKASVASGQVDSGHDHYVETGAQENRVCSTVFDSDWYRDHYADVGQFLKLGLVSSSYDHFCRYGRKALYNGCADFDEREYRAAYPDVDEQIRSGCWVDGLHHFVTVGLYEARLPKQSATEDRREQNIVVSELARLELRAFLKGTERLVFPVCQDPIVSILLILYNRAELTLHCLRSIQRWVDVPYEVLIIDNASSDSTKALLHRLEGAGVIENGQNIHFLRAANQGSEMARGKYLLFLNNDSELQAGAVSSAVEILEQEVDIGAVGAKLILHNGVLQEAGSYLLDNGMSAQFGRGDLPFQSDYQHRRDVPYCSGAFLMTPAALFADCGRFDPVFEPAYCEDADYCLRLWKKGRRVTFNPSSIVLHHETGSSQYRRFLYPSVLRNIAIFRDRYRNYLATMPDYAVAPISSLDGSAMRRAYLVVVESIADAKGDEKLKVFLAGKQRENSFVTIYPLQVWTGYRTDLLPDIPADVEVVAGRGQDQLEDFERSRRPLYCEVVFTNEWIPSDDFAELSQDHGKNEVASKVRTSLLALKKAIRSSDPVSKLCHSEVPFSTDL